METNKQLTVRLFDEYIKFHIIGDLKVLDGIQSPAYLNTCAVPTAMIVLSALDFIGFLLQTNSKLDNTKSNIKFALKYNEYFPKEYNDVTINELVVFYRDGIMHHFYPRQTNSKAYGIHKSSATCLFETVQNKDQQIRSLNANKLSKDFKVFINKLYEEIINKSEDNILFTNMKKGFKMVYPINISEPSISSTPETTSSIGVTYNK